ncbi:unnamed protein product, partial [Urochloa humidicola]
ASSNHAHPLSSSPPGLSLPRSPSLLAPSAPFPEPGERRRGERRPHPRRWQRGLGGGRRRPSPATTLTPAKPRKKSGPAPRSGARPPDATVTRRRSRTSWRRRRSRCKGYGGHTPGADRPAPRLDSGTISSRPHLCSGGGAHARAELSGPQAAAAAPRALRRPGLGDELRPARRARSGWSWSRRRAGARRRRPHRRGRLPQLARYSATSSSSPIPPTRWIAASGEGVAARASPRQWILLLGTHIFWPAAPPALALPSPLDLNDEIEMWTPRQKVQRDDDC